MPLSPAVCIIDDDEAIRESLRLLLMTQGLASRAYATADDFLGAHESFEITCMLLDMRMPGMDGLELFERLQREHAPFPVIFITGHGDIPLAVSAIKLGAFDFLTKPFQQGELIDKVKLAIERYTSGREELRGLEEARARLASCTPRERDVLRLLVQGLPNKAIARTLGISPRTVEIHRAHVMQKMGAASLPVLVQMISRLEGNDSPA